MQLEQYIEDVGGVLWQWLCWGGAAFVVSAAVFVVVCFLLGFQKAIKDAKPKPKAKKHNIDEDEIYDRMKGTKL